MYIYIYIYIINYILCYKTYFQKLAYILKLLTYLGL